MRCFLLMVLFSLLFSAYAMRLSAQNNVAAETFLRQQLKLNSHPLALDDGKLSGEGADFLWQEARKAQFFLIGEEHGIAENPLFAAAVLQELNRCGYKYFASEIGRLTAARLEEAAQHKSVRELLVEFNHQYPFSLPFYNWQEEGVLLENALKLPHGKLPTVWGLDQEFFFSPVYHFERLRQLAPSARSRAVVDEYCAKTRTELARATEARNPGLAFIVSATAADFDNLDAAFRDRDLEARQILRDLRESWEIYRKNARGDIYGNNVQRSLLLKRNFMSFYNAALKTESMPKVFFKFGAAHVFRGRNYVQVFDLGNMVSELAAARGSTSFHVLVLAAGGTQNKYIPFVGNEADKSRKLDADKVYSYLDARQFPELAAFTGWTIVDLRPIRPLLLSDNLSHLPRGVADVIFGFDAVLVVKEAHPTTLFD